MPLPNIYAKAFVAYGSDEKSPFVNVSYWRQQGSFDDDVTEALALAHSIDDVIGAAMIEVLPADCTYFGTTVRISTSGVINEGFDGTNGGSGNVAGESLPDYAAVIIRKRTAVGGRRGRGRYFIGCVPEASQDTGKILPGATTSSYNVIATAYQTPLSNPNGVWEPCHYSRADDTLVLVTGCLVQSILGTQRRRRLRSAF